MSQTTDHNHYVPRGYLSRWSKDGSHVWEHKLVVPVASFPLWSRATLRGACARPNMYDSHIPGLERDYFERWFKDIVEEPAYCALGRLATGGRLTSENWEALVRFAVAQDARTKKAQEIYSAFEEATLPHIMDEAIRSCVGNFDPDAPSDSRPDYPEDETPIVELTITPDGQGAAIEMSFLTGSTSWVQFTKRLIREFTPKAAQYVWQIIEPHPPQTWPTSDHPLVRFETRDNLNIHGTGWLREGTQIFLPLTPNLALYAKVGETRPRHPVASRTETWDLVRLLIGHADYSIFADRKGYKWIEWESRRRVDAEEFQAARPGRREEGRAP